MSSPTPAPSSPPLPPPPPPLVLPLPLPLLLLPPPPPLLRALSCSGLGEGVDAADTGEVGDDVSCRLDDDEFDRAESAVSLLTPALERPECEPDAELLLLLLLLLPSERSCTSEQP